MLRIEREDKRVEIGWTENPVRVVRVVSLGYKRGCPSLLPLIVVNNG